MADTSTNGNSNAIAAWFEESLAFSTMGAADFVLSGLLSEGIVREPRERLRIQPRSERDKYGHAEGHGLRVAHQHARRIARLLEPGVHDDAEVVVQRGNDIQHRENGEHRVFRLNQREENKI